MRGRARGRGGEELGGGKTVARVDKCFQCTVKEGGGRQVQGRGREEALSSLMLVHLGAEERR